MKKIIFIVSFITMLFGAGNISKADSATPAPTITPAPTVTPIPAYGSKSQIYQYGNYSYKILDVARTQIEITNISNAYGEIVIPNQINGLQVVQIGDRYSEAEPESWTVVIPEGDRSKITGITIPEGVKVIGEYAFYNLVNLKKMQMPDSLDEIMSRAFYKCTALEDMVLPDQLLYIGTRAFSNCISLKKVEFKNIVNMDENAFEYCSLLEKVVFSEKETWVNLSVFEGCDKLTQLTFPKSVILINIDGKYYKNQTLIIKGTDTKFNVLNLELITSMTVMAPKNSQAVKFAKKYNYTYEEVSLPKAPTFNKIKVVKGKKQISWKKISGATAYEVYYSKTKNGTYNKLTTTKNTSYKTTKKGYVKIRAYKNYKSINWYGSYAKKKIS